jgi:hypothetical protein
VPRAITVQELELELKELKLLKKRVEKQFKGSSFPDTEPLNQLISYIDKWIQHTRRHGEELRLQGSIGVTETIDRFFGGLLKTLCALVNMAGIDSFTQTRDTRRTEQDDILLLISELAPQIRDYVAHLNLPSGHILLQALPQPHTLGITVANLPSLTEASGATPIEMTEASSPKEVIAPSTLEILGGVPSPTEAISAASVEITEEVPSPSSEASAPADFKVIGGVTSLIEASSASVEMTEEVPSTSEASATANFERVRIVSSVTEADSEASVEMTEQVPSPKETSIPVNFETMANVTSDAETNAIVISEATSKLAVVTEASVTLVSEKIPTKRRRKGPALGKWSKALGECIEMFGENVNYRRAAQWLDTFKRPEINRFFFPKLVKNRRDKPPLLPKKPEADTPLVSLLKNHGEVRSGSIASSVGQKDWFGAWVSSKRGRQYLP